VARDKSNIDAIVVEFTFTEDYKTINITFSSEEPIEASELGDCLTRFVNDLDENPRGFFSMDEELYH